MNANVDSKHIINNYKSGEIRKFNDKVKIAGMIPTMPMQCSFVCQVNGWSINCSRDS